MGLMNGPANADEPASPFPILAEEPSIGFDVVEYTKQPGISRDHPDGTDNIYGFEGGVFIKLKGVYHMFTARSLH